MKINRKQNEKDNTGNQRRLFMDGESVQYLPGCGYTDTYTVLNGQCDNGYWNYALSNKRFVRQDDLRKVSHHSPAFPPATDRIARKLRRSAHDAADKDPEPQA